MANGTRPLPANRPIRWGATAAVAAIALAGVGLAVPTAQAAGTPAVTVTPNVDVDPAGGTVTVKGTGFDPNINNKFGVYVVFGPADAAVTDAAAFGAQKWVRPGGTPSPSGDNMNADGSFTTTLDIKAAYTDGNGKAVDCLVTQCQVITMAAHGSPNRTQDTRTPVGFKGTTAPVTPKLAVTPATGAKPDGQTFTVTGTGFDPVRDGGNGIYVAFGPKNADWNTNPAPYQATKWVRTNPAPSPSQAKLNADGSFSVTFDAIKAKYKNADGVEINCATVGCYVVTFAAHGSPERNQDTFVPVAFATTPNPPGPGTGYQVITTDVQGGPLTLGVGGNNVTLPGVTLTGKDAFTSGALNPLTVADARGTNAGWNLTGQASDLTAAGGRIVGDNLGWTPVAKSVTGSLPTGGAAPQVAAGAKAEPGSGLGQARTLCSSAAGASAGAFECGGELKLGVPGVTVPGTYTGTLTLTLI
ncbi:Htaa domain-containing protein [Streptomyces sp. SID3343]|uniref:Htaa domain-containing protein n=1 Tax=Streptomyces sp. SID3343 TaxID=2690260 RepID=UPI00136B92E5|nr:Htaa domain-containing protein [Streptomyces sp. SID3343]MYW03537.1 Htaa domain-containing protein [Streptomyces sp. SID3343]